MAYGYGIVATAPTFRTARDRLRGDEDLVIVEPSIAHESLETFLRELHAHAAPPRVIATSGRASRPEVFRLRGQGVCAYLDKPFAAAALHHCLQRLDQNAFCASRSSLRRLESTATTRLEAVIASYRDRFQLTLAETEVLDCVVRGMCRADIAAHRTTSINTVKTQLKSLLAKSGAASLREIVLSAARDAHRGVAETPSVIHPLR